MNRDDLISRGHVERLKDEETDMYSVIFRNADGSKTLYMFAQPVKYVASNGEIRNKSTEITNVIGGYAMTDNDVNVSVGITALQGATISKNNNAVTITPIGSDAVASRKGNAVYYNGVFGDNTMLSYSTLLSGIKPTILLRSEGNTTAFSFELNTNGLTPTPIGGAIALGNQDGETIFNVGTFVVTDANGNFYESEMHFSGNSTDGYTVTADASAFLSGDNIAYPVLVQPTLNYAILYEIQDTAIYSDMPNNNFSMYNSYRIGHQNPANRTGRLLVKFPSLFSNRTFASLNTGDIRESHLELVTLASGNPMLIEAYCPKGFSWTASNVTWNSAAYLEDTSQLMMYNYAEVPSKEYTRVRINITGMIKLGKEDADEDYDYANEGVYIVSSVEDYNQVRSFCGTQYGYNINGDYTPLICVSYHTSERIQVQLKATYDWGFVDRYANGILGQNGINCYTALYQVMNPTIQYFNDNLGVQLNTSPMYSIPYSSVPDTCPNLIDHNSYCTCPLPIPTGNYIDNTNLHHTNHFHTRNSAMQGNIDSHIAVNFIGQATCMDCDTAGGCVPSRLGGTASPNFHCCIIYSTGMTYISQSTTESVFFHELAHLYGATDHYRVKEDDVLVLLPGQDDDCIWGENRHQEEIWQSKTICVRCRNSIYNNIEKYDHKQ